MQTAATAYCCTLVRSPLGSHIQVWVSTATPLEPRVVYGVVDTLINFSAPAPSRGLLLQHHYPAERQPCPEACVVVPGLWHLLQTVNLSWHVRGEFDYTASQGNFELRNNRPAWNKGLQPSLDRLCMPQNSFSSIVIDGLKKGWAHNKNIALRHLLTPGVHANPHNMLRKW